MSDTQQVSYNPTFLMKARRFFSLPRFHIALLESQDKMRAIFMRGFYKNEGLFAIDRFDLEEKEKLQTYWTESVSILDLVKALFRSKL